MADPSFALHELGWHDFQQLCHTVLRELLGQTVVSFLDTKDGGRDGAFTGRWKPDGTVPLDGEYVFQCKHTSIPDNTLSLSDVADELDKAMRLVNQGRCDIYVLMTNARVTGESALQIVNAFKGRGVKHVQVFGATWMNSTIAASSRLRRLVPRLYGLGDLTQILDDRAYRQAQAVLEAMRTDLAKLVRTGVYSDAANVLGSHGFVLLIGPPAAGKTSMAAQLALGAADDFDAAIVKLDTITDLEDRWNPDESQLFWLDDAFGATQFDASLARVWTSALLRIKGAISAGSRFIITSRDYIYRAAHDQLKPGSLPLVDTAQVVIDVAKLTDEEKVQILYNHLRLGRQPTEFLGALQPHLDKAARHPGFTPELARRLSEPVFTGKVNPAELDSVMDFFANPSAFLREVLGGLDSDGRAALGLIYINRNWVASPIHFQSTDADLIARVGSDLGGVTQALADLNRSLVSNISRQGNPGWTFAHPTMADAYADLLRVNPELLHHLIRGFPLDVLFTQITCGDVGLEGAIIVPPGLYPLVLERLEEPDSGEMKGWMARSRRAIFLSTRCDRQFLAEWADRNDEFVMSLSEPGLMLDADDDNRIITRLHEFGLLREMDRRRFAEGLTSYCIEGVDPTVLWDTKLASVLTDTEREALLRAVRGQIVPNLRAYVDAHVDNLDYDERYGPEASVSYLRTLADELPRLFPGDASVSAAAVELEGLIDDWVASKEWVEPEGKAAVGIQTGPLSPTATEPARSVFDDLLVGYDPEGH